jgi:hypothetical protein
MHLREHEVEIFRPPQTVFLGQVDVPVKFAKDLKQGIMGIQVEVQLFPHLRVRRIGHATLQRFETFNLIKAFTVV